MPADHTTASHPGRLGALVRAACCRLPQPNGNEDLAHEPGGPGRSTSPEARARRSLWGWSPPPLPADTPLKRRVDRLLPATGMPLLFYFGVIVALLMLAPALPRRGELAADGLAALAAGGWCGLNFWRCRHAHCLITSAGWLGLSVLAFTEAGLGHSLVGGDEQLMFIGVLLLAVAFEVLWYGQRGTNAVTPGRRDIRG
jgi:hypothetical protein